MMLGGRRDSYKLSGINCPSAPGSSRSEFQPGGWSVGDAWWERSGDWSEGDLGLIMFPGKGDRLGAIADG